MDAPQAGAPSGTADTDSDFAIGLIAIGKRQGISFDEMRELRVRDLMDLINAMLPSDQRMTGLRTATQADIDRLLA